MSTLKETPGGLRLCLELADDIKTNSQKESKSDFHMGGYHLISRFHRGDENGQTTCKFGRFKPDKNVIGFVYVPQAPFSEKESESNVKCGQGEVIIRRRHLGDENKSTEYTFAKVYAEYKDGSLFPCYWDENTYKEKMIKESLKNESDQTAEIEGKSMVSRRHFGDENAHTTTGFADFYTMYFE